MKGIKAFKPYLFKPGKYNVYIWNPSSHEYDAKVPVVVNHSKGTERIIVDQQEIGGKWIKLGTWTFGQGYLSTLTIIGEKGKFVIADAVKFEFVD